MLWRGAYRYLRHANDRQNVVDAPFRVQERVAYKDEYQKEPRAKQETNVGLEAAPIDRESHSSPTFGQRGIILVILGQHPW